VCADIFRRLDGQVVNPTQFFNLIGAPCTDKETNCEPLFRKLHNNDTHRSLVHDQGRNGTAETGTVKPPSYNIFFNVILQFTSDFSK
jgi:hypothetical protein